MATTPGVSARRLSPTDVDVRHQTVERRGSAGELFAPGGAMLHYVGRSVPGTLLIHSWREGVVLFRLLLERAPGADLVVMPDHFHLLTEHEIVLAGAMSAYARWRNHARGTHGAVWEAAPAPSEPGDPKKQRRTLRYVFLNPCRAQLVTDPLAWPMSTYRDAIGIAVPAVRARVADPARLHGYVSRDDTVFAGSLLPFGNGAVLTGDAGLRAVEAAVSEVARVPFAALRARGPARALLVAAARKLVDVPVAQVAAFVGADDRTVRRLRHASTADVRLVERLILDPRFPGLPDGDLRRMPRWELYAAARRRRNGV